MNIRIKMLAVCVTVAFAATFARGQTFPSIIVQPASQATAPSGTISFSVSASGAGTLAYQWAKNTTNLANGTFSGRATVSGATTSTLTLTTCTTNDQANYTCRITNTFGSVTSSIASLTVYIAPTITTQPLGQTNAVGSNITFTVVASGSTPFTYQWQKNNTDIPSATLNVYTINNAATNNSGSYTVAVGNPAGTVNSAAANLLILAPPVITSQPADTVVLSSNSATFFVAATGSFLTYQWKQNGVPIIGATNATFSVSNAPYSLSGSSYNVVITNYLKKITSSNATLSVVGIPVIYSTLNQGLAAYYSFSGNANDSSGNGNNGVNNGATLTANRFGTANEAYSFNGVSNVISIPDFYQADANVHTMSFWMQADSWDNTFHTAFVDILGKDNLGSGTRQWVCQGLKSGQIRWAVFTSVGEYDLDSISQLQTGQWYQVATVWDGTNESVFINGKFDGSVSAPGTLIQSNAPVRIGGDPIGHQYFSGSIDDVRIYNRALSSNEVGQLYGLESGSNSFSMIGGQLQSQTVVVGSNATFSVTATAGASQMFFQWFNTNGAIANQTNALMILNNVQLTDSGSSYFVVITNSYGSVTSSVATLYVGYPPAIIQQPVSVTNLFGGNANLSCIVTGTPPIALQWLQNGAALAGQTNATLSVSNVQSVMTGLQLFATNAFGVTISSDASISFAIAPQNFSIGSSISNGVSIQFQGTPGFSYTIQAATNLVSPIAWQFIFTNLADSNGNCFFQDTNFSPVRFYRALAPTP